MSTPNKSPRQPRTPWGGPASGAGGQVNPFHQARRVILSLFTLFNPVAGVLTAFVVTIGTRRAVLTRVKAWWVVTAGVAGAVVAIITPGIRTYLRPWREIGTTAADNVGTGGALGPALVRVVSDLWSSWMMAQLPLASGLALIAGGIVMWRREKFRAYWREENDEPDALWQQPEKVTRRAHQRAEKVRMPSVTERTAFADLAMRFGVDENKRLFPLTGAQLRSHVLAISPTGYGKSTILTKFLQGWIVQWAPRRLAAVVIDFKADPDLREAVRAMAYETGRRSHEVTLDLDSDTYNPIARGTAPEVAARVLGALADARDGGFSEPHHRVVGQRWLNLAIAVLDGLVAANAPRRDKQPWRRDLHHLAELMIPDVLAAHAAAIDGSLRHRADDLVAEVEAEKDLKKSISGMRQRLANMTETGAGHLMVQTDDGVDLEQVIRRGDVAIFSLSSSRNGEAVQTLGNLLINDLTGIFGRLEEERWAKKNDARVAVVLDEFGALSGTSLVDFIERARSAGGTAVVTAQTEANLVEVSPEFAEKVYANSNIWLLGRQEGDAAESRANAIGTRKGWAETQQITEDVDPFGGVTAGSGVGSLRRVNEFRVHPDELRGLGIGQVVVRIGQPAVLARVRVTQAQEWNATRRKRPSATLQAEAKPAPPAAPTNAAIDLAKNQPVPANTAAVTDGGGWDDHDDDTDW